MRSFHAVHDATGTAKRNFIIFSREFPAQVCPREFARASVLLRVCLRKCSLEMFLKLALRTTSTLRSCPAHLNSAQVALHKRACFCVSSSITGNASVCAFCIISRQLLQTHPRAHESSKSPQLWHIDHPALTKRIRHRFSDIDTDPLREHHTAQLLHIEEDVMFCREGARSAALKITLISRAGLLFLAQLRPHKLSCTRVPVQVRSRKLSRARVLAQVCSCKLSRTCSRASVLAQVVSRASCLAHLCWCKRARESVSCRRTRARRLTQCVLAPENFCLQGAELGSAVHLTCRRHLPRRQQKNEGLKASFFSNTDSRQTNNSTLLCAGNRYTRHIAKQVNQSVSNISDLAQTNRGAQASFCRVAPEQPAMASFEGFTNDLHEISGKSCGPQVKVLNFWASFFKALSRKL